MSATKPIGQVITFYSYKGGTGRSMALANVACLLAQKWSDGKDVLMIDWDLEAPGLHRFFQGRLNTPPDIEEETVLKEYPGLIDLFQELDKATPNGETEQTEETAKELVHGIDLDRFILSTTVPFLKLMKAGQFDDGYSARVNSFRWEEFYERSPWLIRAFAERLTEQYRYVLIDSRTGFTDISGICTMLMPERLVSVFTPNHQSLRGVLEQVQRATEYRRRSDDLRPLVVFPLPSRIEAAEPQLREDWRLGNPGKGLGGYQPEFESLFAEIYDLLECNLQNYFDEVQIQHIPRYAYGEEIAVLVERTDDRLSLKRSYESFTEKLVDLSGPWEEKTQSEEQSATIDILISYNDQTLPQAQALGEALNRRGFTPWLAHEQVPPGRPLQPAILQEIAQTKAVIVLVGSEGTSGQQDDHIQAVIERKVIPLIPIFLPNADWENAPSLLLTLHWIAVGKAITDVDILDKLEWGITGKKPNKTARSIKREF